MTVSGFEYLSADAVKKLAGSSYDEYFTDKVGNHVFVKRSGKENAKKILIDAHYDEIGMMVTKISKNGYLSVISVGGIDTAILSASKVYIYGKEIVPGIVAALSPHLRGQEDEDALPEITEMIIDTGIPYEKLKEIVSLGTPVGFSPCLTELMNNNVCGKGFDNKASVAAGLDVLERLHSKNSPYDVYLLLSCKEELSLLGGRVGAFNIMPDAAIVLDVNFARTPDTKKRETIELGKGPSISFSALTDRKLTKKVIAYADTHNHPLQKIAEAGNTGTNGNVIPLTGAGVPTVVMSIPLKNMHTFAEIVNLADIDSAASLIADMLGDGELI